MIEQNPIRIAMWSGPRNLSTALMRAWESRRDTSVIDEPFYACYLVQAGVEHPMQEQILASQPHHWEEVIEQRLSGSLPEGAQIQYQKQMTHHMVAPLDEDWFGSVKHAFLLRHPQGVVASYRHKRDSVVEADLGYAKQAELYQKALSLGQTPPVLDAGDVLQNPEAYLRLLCEALDIEFDKNMLHWPPGLRKSDGVWAPHWYNNVATSTGFTEYKKPNIALNDYQQAIADECLPHYLELFQHRLQLDTK